jgi:hypothetical protein
MARHLGSEQAHRLFQPFEAAEHHVLTLAEKPAIVAGQFVFRDHGHEFQRADFAGHDAALRVQPASAEAAVEGQEQRPARQRRHVHDRVDVRERQVDGLFAEHRVAGPQRLSISSAWVEVAVPVTMASISGSPSAVASLATLAPTLAGERLGRRRRIDDVRARNGCRCGPGSVAGPA